MNVLSLFDGISSGQVALERAGHTYTNYYSSEVDKYALSVTRKNFPGTIQFGDVRNWREWDWDSMPHIDLLIAGSPCQGFSFAGKQLNFEDPRSVLFFEFADILKTIQPTWWLLENVKMKQEYQDVISDFLGVNPIPINSSLVSAQNRRRLYWTNIPNVTQPEDKHIYLKDIIHEVEFYSMVNKGQEIVKPIDKAITIMARDHKGFGNQAMTGVFEWLNEYIVPFDKTLQILDKEVQRGKVGYFRKDSQANRVYYIHDKAVTLTGEAGGGAAKMGQYLFGCITPDRINKNQNGQRFNEGRKFYTLTAQDKHGILIEGYIRKLTPIECERLQTLPDDFTKFGLTESGDLTPISNSQRYRLLGNGWTVDVIAHILKHIPRTGTKSKAKA